MLNRGFDQAERARFRAAAHRHAFPRLDRKGHASVILHVPCRAQHCPMERAHRLVRCPRAGSLDHHAGGPYRVLERFDVGAACATLAGEEVVLCGDEGRIRP